MEGNTITIETDDSKLEISNGFCWIDGNSTRIDISKDFLSGTVTIGKIVISDIQRDMLIKFLQH